MPCAVEREKKNCCMNKSLDISTKSAFILCSHLLGEGERERVGGKKSISVEKVFPFNPFRNERRRERKWGLLSIQKDKNHSEKNKLLTLSSKAPR